MKLIYFQSLINWNRSLFNSFNNNLKIIFFCLNYVICIVENNIFFDILYILAVYSQHILSEGKKSLCEKKITFYTQGIRLFAVRRAQVWMRLKILVDANVVDGTVRACGESTLRGRIEAQSSLGSSLTTSTVNGETS